MDQSNYLLNSVSKTTSPSIGMVRNPGHLGGPQAHPLNYSISEDENCQLRKTHLEVQIRQRNERISSLEERISELMRKNLSLKEIVQSKQNKQPDSYRCTG